jgi:hypothetical protein
VGTWLQPCSGSTDHVHGAGIGAAVDHDHAQPFGYRDQALVEQQTEPVQVAILHAAGAADEHDDQPWGAQAERSQRGREVGRLVDRDRSCRPRALEADRGTAGSSTKWRIRTATGKHHVRLRLACSPCRRGGRPAQARPGSSATTSTTEWALPSSAVQLRRWSWSATRLLAGRRHRWSVLQ